MRKDLGHELKLGTATAKAGASTLSRLDELLHGGLLLSRVGNIEGSSKENLKQNLARGIDQKQCQIMTSFYIDRKWLLVNKIFPVSIEKTSNMGMINIDTQC